MPASEVQGPLGFQLSIPPHIPGTRSLAYSHPEDQLLTPARARSQPIGESRQGPLSGRRSQSESSLSHIPPPMLSPPLPLPVADNAAPDEPASAPSPVPTEIIPIELTQEEIVDEIQRLGIKVRDFACEKAPVDQHAPEQFDPILAWHVYEVILENPNPTRNPLNGRHLRRLLDLGWVSEETDGHRWLPKDREALEKFDSRPHYPWKSLNLQQPKKEELKEVATVRFQWVNADQLVPQFVNRGISRLAAALRGPRGVTPRYQKRPSPSDESTDTDQDTDTSPRLKKRRLSTGAGYAPSTSRQPPVHFPLALVNGKPPQQFPAGHLPANPPRPPALPAQGAFTRSLQRHLSMASVTSSRSTDLSRSDSRTALAQGTNRD